MSLYANLLGEKGRPEQGATISGAPVKYDIKAEEAETQKKKDGIVT